MRSGGKVVNVSSTAGLPSRLQPQLRARFIDPNVTKVCFCEYARLYVCVFVCVFVCMYNYYIAVAFGHWLRLKGDGRYCAIYLQIVIQVCTHASVRIIPLLFFSLLFYSYFSS